MSTYSCVKVNDQSGKFILREHYPISEDLCVSFSDLATIRRVKANRYYGKSTAFSVRVHKAMIRPPRKETLSTSYISKVEVRFDYVSSCFTRTSDDMPFITISAYFTNIPSEDYDKLLWTKRIPLTSVKQSFEPNIIDIVKLEFIKNHLNDAEFLSHLAKLAYTIMNFTEPELFTPGTMAELITGEVEFAIRL